MARHFVLTGGIGSGKTTAGEHFGEFGADVISADGAGHRVLSPGGEAAEGVAARWPEAVRDGVIDRPALAGIVFGDQAELDELERLTHPAIRRRVADEVARSTAPVVMVETPVPHIVRQGWPRIVVDAPEATRAERLTARGMSTEDVAARIARQPTRGEWLALADVVVDNSGDPAHLEDECRRVWEWITGR